MSFVLLFDLNIFSIIILFALLIVTYSKNEGFNVKNRLFRLIIISTILMLVLEIFSWVFDGKPGELNYYLIFSMNFLLIALNTVVASLWASYIDYLVFEDNVRLKRRFYYFFPSVVMIILSIINIFHPILFKVDEFNVYSRLPLIWISLTMTLVMYLYILVMVYKKRDTLNDKVIFGVLLFLLLPMFAALMQLFFYGLLLIWAATAVALIFSYLIFETTSSGTDYLTGASTRMRAEDYINSHIKKHRKFTAIMIDIDDFKVLNDTYGHHIGDKALIGMSKILRRVYREKSVVCRFGGDEFLIVTETTDSGKIEFFKHEILRHLRLSDNEHIKQLKFGYGYAHCLVPEEGKVEEIMVEADNNMYMDKAKNKNFKRRKSDS